MKRFLFNNFWNWKEYDIQFSLFEIRYFNSGYIYPNTKFTQIIILNFGFAIEVGEW